MSSFLFICPQSWLFWGFFVRQVACKCDVIPRTKLQCKANLMENGDFLHPQSATCLASNHINLGMRPFYPFNWYILEAFKNRIISSAENGGGTQTVEQLRTVTPGTGFLIKNLKSLYSSPPPQSWFLYIVEYSHLTEYAFLIKNPASADLFMCP